MNMTAQSCPANGVWRAWLDQEDHTPGLAAHLAECAGCQRLLADLRSDATDAGAALALLAPTGLPSAADTALARERLDWRRRAPAVAEVRRPRGVFAPRVSTAWRVAASGLVAAVTLSLLVGLTPQGQSTAAAFLSQFRSLSVSAVEITPQSQGEIVRTLNALGNLGTVKGANGQTRPEALARGAAEQAQSMSLQAASAAVGFALQTPDPALLPASIEKTPHVQVMPASQVRFTFDKVKARAYLDKNGHPEVDLPDRFDGATLVVSIPAAALLQYGGGNSREALVIGQAGELVVDVEGGKVSLDELRDFLLNVPGLPAGVVSQLRQIKSWNDTLPIPVPVDRVNWQSASFQGNQGLLLNDNSGVGSAAIWHSSGHLYGMAGSLKATELKRIAETLAVHN